MGRLADPAIPGTDKVGLVQYGTPADAAALDRFAKALNDSGYAPLTFEAADLMWAQGQPGNVIANVTMKPGGPAATDKNLQFPMEFSPQRRLLAADPADRGLAARRWASSRRPRQPAEHTRVWIGWLEFDLLLGDVHR